MDDPNRLMHPVSGGQVGLMHQPYGLPPVNVGVNVGVNMASLDGVNQESENMGGRKQVRETTFYQVPILSELYHEFYFCRTLVRFYSRS